jgi:hypothetical protein
MTHPFDLDDQALGDHLEDMVNATFSDIQSEFLVLPRGRNLVDYTEFRQGYECLKRHTRGFEAWTSERVWAAVQEDTLVFVVLRTIIGVSPPEWAELAGENAELAIPQNAARTLDVKFRKLNPKTGRRDWIESSRYQPQTIERIKAMIDAAVINVRRGAPPVEADAVHRLAKIDTQHGMESLRHVATQHVPYAMLLYERFLGRPFASHRDSVSELVGDVMENAVEERLARAGVSYRKTGRAERLPGFEQAPDFFVPDEIAPTVIIEAKITSDDGTARDKVARILRLANMRDQAEREGKQGFEVVACIDGRGFGQRRQDMRDMLRATRGKVFTLATLDRLVESTEIDAYRVP